MTHLDDAALDAIEAREAEAWPERDDCNDDKDRLRASVNDVRPLLAAVREARAAATDAEQRAQAAEAALQRVRELAEWGAGLPYRQVSTDQLRRALGDDQQEGA